MICPYIRRREVYAEQWCNDAPHADLEAAPSGQTVKTIELYQLDCPKEGCAVWYDGRCHFGAVDLQND